MAVWFLVAANAVEDLTAIMTEALTRGTATFNEHDIINRLTRLEGRVEGPVEAPRKVRVSEVGSTEWAGIEEDAQVKLQGYVGDVKSYQPRKAWKDFQWDISQTERQQSEKYIRHMQDFIDVDSYDYGFADVAADNSFLSFQAFGRSFVGTSDVAITARSCVPLLPGVGLKFIVELKKNLQPDKGLNRAQGYQAMISLLLATLKYRNSQPLALLTNLQKTWFIMWIDADIIWYYLFRSASDAVGYLEHFLEISRQRMKNPRMKIEPHDLDIIWGAKRAKLLATIEEGQPSGEGRLSELDGLLSFEEEQYFRAHRLVCQLRAVPGFDTLPAESVGLNSHFSEPPPFMYL